MKKHPRTHPSDEEKCIISQAITESRGNVNEFVQLIKKRKPSRGILKLLVKDLDPNPKTKINQKGKKKMVKSESEQELFQEETQQPAGILLYADPNAWSRIEEAFQHSDRKTVHKDFDWFQKEYQKGNESHYYPNAGRDNEHVLKALEKYLKRRAENEKAYIDKKDIDKAIHLLYDYYVK